MATGSRDATGEGDPQTRNPDFFRSFGRREQVAQVFSRPSAIPRRRGGPRAPRWRVARRAVFWTLHLALYGLARAVPIWGSERRRARRAVLFRKMLQAGGTVSHKLGQQLSIRTDVLDPVLCDELRKLLDTGPPMAVDAALEILESSYGRRPETVFRFFDPEPIGSASIACVYQAELHSGERVAVKVRRPGLVPRLAADLAILHWIARLLESLALVRAGSATSVTSELRRMLLEEADFTMEARYLELFRKDSRSVRFVTAPKLYPQLSDEQILVTEFCSGAFLSEFLTAIETGQTAKLQPLLDRGFDLRKISRSLGQTFLWSVFEADVFHADVHPANIVVLPDNSLIFIDFGSCGQFSEGFREKLRELIRGLHKGDCHGSAKVSLALCEPIPLIDTNPLLEDLQDLYRRYYLAVRSRYSDWTEKTSGGVFLDSIKILGWSGVNANAELVRYCRANMLYDTMIFRLYPDADPVKELRRYEKGYFKRRAKKIGKQQLKQRPERTMMTLSNTVESASLVLRRVRRYLDVPRFSFTSGVSKLSNVVSLVIGAGSRLALLLLVVTAGRTLALVRRSSLAEQLSWPELARNLRWVVWWPPFQLVALVTLVVVARKIWLTLQRVEVKNEL